MKLHILITLISIIVSKAEDLNAILYAEITCCPVHTSEAQCDAEAGSVCQWIDNPEDAIAIAGGSQCLGVGYIECKEANGADAICSGPPPGVPGAPAPPAPPGSTPAPPGTNPICGPAPTEQPTTPMPTMAPTPLCTYQENYDLIGQSCVISGDPHTTTFNSQRHDFQGQPDIPDPTDNIIKDQYYYIHACHDYDTSDMPFNVLVTHHKWGTRSVSGVDYLTLELFDNNGDMYYVYISSKLHNWGMKGAGAVSHYDKSTGLAALVSGHTQNIGSKFSLYYSQDSESSGVYVTLIINDQNSVDPCVFKIYMKRQTNKVDGRYRMHYVSMTQSTCYKCATCGLCAGFDNGLNANGEKFLETCNGHDVVYRNGWNGDKTPEAYDFTAWTWEKNFVENSCTVYPITENDGGMVYVDPCAHENKAKVAAACQAARDAMSDCCAKIGDGTTFCDNLQADCDFDACAAVGAGATDAAIQHEVELIFTEPVELACRNPDMINDFICTSRRGTSIAANTIGESRAECVGNEVLVSCGIDGWHNIGGTKVVNDVCIASTDGPAQKTTYAMAYCCAFPTLANAQIQTAANSNADVEVTSTCPSGSELTGCQAFHENGPINQLRGTYTGQQNAPPQQSAWISTDNQCNSGGRAMKDGSKSTVIGGAQCVTVSNDYNFQCKTRAKYAIKTDTPMCEDGFHMVSCNAWVTSDATLDDYHMNNAGLCYTQDDGYQKLYANVVCCSLTKLAPNKHHVNYVANVAHSSGLKFGYSSKKKHVKSNNLEFVALGNKVNGKVNDNGMMNGNYGLFLENGYIELLGGMVFVIVLYGIIKYILCKRNDDKYIPISDPKNSRKNYV